MADKILITGASGLIGRPLVKALLDDGYIIHQLTTQKKKVDAANHKYFSWDVYNDEIDPSCVDGITSIIHLAGEGIADKRWTKKRKKEIVDSRVKSLKMIYELLDQKNEHQVKCIISASAIGYYSDRGDELLTEDKPPANDFLGKVCVEWEQQADEGLKLGLRVVKLRTGVVLDDAGGALKQMAFPVKMGLGASLGNGTQWVSWIHRNDVIKTYLFALKNEINGAFNMAAPNPVTNKGLTKAIAKQLKKPLWLPNVPAFALKLALGELSTVVLGSTKTSPEKLQAVGFRFEYLKIEKALANIYG